MYGRGQALLGTRELVLLTAGFVVNTTVGLEEVSAQLSIGEAHGLLIACQTASVEDPDTLAAHAEHAALRVYQIDRFVTPNNLIRKAAAQERAMNPSSTGQFRGNSRLTAAANFCIASYRGGRSVVDDALEWRDHVMTTARTVAEAPGFAA